MAKTSSGVPYTNDPQWDMRGGFFEQLNRLQELMSEARASRRIEEWFNFADDLTARVSPMLDQQERDICRKRIEEIDQALHDINDVSELDDEYKDRFNNAYRLLRDYQYLVFTMMHEHGILTPRKVDPRHAVTQGYS